MEIELIAISFGLLAIAMLLQVKRNRAGVAAQKEVLQKRLIEVAQNSELTKRACFASLENLNQRLEQIQSRAKATEEKLNCLVEPTKVERKENYQAAALLLAGGHSVAKVSTMLGLAASEVELVGQLQKFAVKEPSAGSARQNETADKPMRRRRKRTGMAEKTRLRERPMLLTEIVTVESASGSNLDGHLAELNGAAA